MPKSSSKVRDIWTQTDSTILMDGIINIHSSYKELSNGELGVPSTFWKQVSEFIKIKGLLREPLQCKVRWKNLKARYKDSLHSDDCLDELGTMVKYVGTLQGLHPSRPNKASFSNPPAVLPPQPTLQYNVSQPTTYPLPPNVHSNNIPNQPIQLSRVMLNSTHSNSNSPMNLPIINPTISNINRTMNLNNNMVNGNTTITHPNMSLPNSIPPNIPSNLSGEDLNSEEFTNLLQQYRRQWEMLQDQQIYLLGKLVEVIQKKPHTNNNSNNSSNNHMINYQSTPNNTNTNNTNILNYHPANSMNSMNMTSQLNHHPNSIN